MLFGVPAAKDARGSRCHRPRRHPQRRARATCARRSATTTVVMADLCLDEFTDHGHCGVLTADGSVDNDATLARLRRRWRCAQAEAGAHVVGPSGMMDGQVGGGPRGAGRRRIPPTSRPRLRGEVRVGVLRPVPRGRRLQLQGDRRAYQQDPANGREALREVAPRHRRGRRHRDGQARDGLPRRGRARSARRSTCRWPPTRSRASTRWSRPPPRTAGSTVDAGDPRDPHLDPPGRGRIVLTYWAAEAAGWLR